MERDLQSSFKLSIVNLSHYRYLSKCQLQSFCRKTEYNGKSENLPKNASCRQERGRWRVGVDLPLAFQAQRMPQSAKQDYSEHQESWGRGRQQILTVIPRVSIFVAAAAPAPLHCVLYLADTI